MTTIARQELEKHSVKDDAWILFRGEVYDVTKYVNEHPGGLAILRYAGKDASKAISEQAAHKCVFNFILSKLKTFHIGKLAENFRSRYVWPVLIYIWFSIVYLFYITIKRLCILVT
ncbi:cytochrome b5-like [Dermacentor variabilis]|uniref:cytochrome b5-like n=1 Tax=Dermacentor variabilis TaxID=34621 RepID=UPI003F5B3466